MLSWSSHEAGAEPDLTAISGDTPIEGVPLGDELLRFAGACAGRDADELARARASLVEAAGEAFTVDAAAVACNFEMMTRLADATGARMPASVLEERAAVIGATGVAELTSRR